MIVEKNGQYKREGKIDKIILNQKNHVNIKPKDNKRKTYVFVKDLVHIHFPLYVILLCLWPTAYLMCKQQTPVIFYFHVLNIKIL